MKLPEFIGNAVPSNELQLHHNYALVYKVISEDDEGLNVGLWFHSLNDIPSQRVMEAAVREPGEGVTLAIVEMLYWDADVWTVRSLVNNNIFTLDRRDGNLVAVKSLN